MLPSNCLFFFFPASAIVTNALCKKAILIFVFLYSMVITVVIILMFVSMFFSLCANFILFKQYENEKKEKQT